MRHHRPREAIAVAAQEASRAITVAGITLAATFALLAMVPLEPFRQLAVLMALGVLLDALFVRPLLIPALIALMGRFAWWPSRLRPAGSARAFYKEVASRAGQDRAYAVDVSRATLVTLSERIPAREADELAHGCPTSSASSCAASITRSRSPPTSSSCAWPSARGRRAAAEEDAPVVVAVLASTLAPGEIEYLRAALPGDYAWLFGDARPGTACRGHDERVAGTYDPPPLELAVVDRDLAVIVAIVGFAWLALALRDSVAELGDMATGIRDPGTAIQSSGRATSRRSATASAGGRQPCERPAGRRGPPLARPPHRRPHRRRGRA